MSEQELELMSLRSENEAMRAYIQRNDTRLHELTKPSYSVGQRVRWRAAWDQVQNSRMFGQQPSAERLGVIKSVEWGWGSWIYNISGMGNILEHMVRPIEGDPQ